MENESIETDDVSSTESKPNWRRELEAKAARATELEGQLQEMQRKEVFRDAGLNTSDRMTEYFMKGYEGELSIEAIRSEAGNLGLSAMTTQASIGNLAEQQAQQQAQFETERRIQDAVDDAGPVSDPSLNELIRQTNNPEELRALWESNGGTWNAMV